jgi:hypothetical protein
MSRGVLLERFLRYKRETKMATRMVAVQALFSKQQIMAFEVSAGPDRAHSVRIGNAPVDVVATGWAPERQEGFSGYQGEDGQSLQPPVLFVVLVCGILRFRVMSSYVLTSLSPRLERATTITTMQYGIVRS